MSKAETDAEIARNEFVEKYISEMQWDASTPDEIRGYVIGNLRGFWSRVEASNTELRKRYSEARSLLKRCVDAYDREGFEDGDTMDDAAVEAMNWLSQEELEEEVFGD
jgi:predicted phage gp36 major capsid-like protein